MAKKLVGVDATDSGLDSKPCHDWFDGGEPRTWARFSLGDRAFEGAAHLREEAKRDGWNEIGTSTAEGLTETTFSKDFNGWSAQLTVSSGPGSQLSSVMGADTEVRAQVASERYCTGR
jgi:hypothetical protein